MPADLNHAPLLACGLHNENMQSRRNAVCASVRLMIQEQTFFISHHIISGLTNEDPGDRGREN